MGGTVRLATAVAETGGIEAVPATTKPDKSCDSEVANPLGIYLLNFKIN